MINDKRALQHVLEKWRMTEWWAEVECCQPTLSAFHIFGCLGAVWWKGFLSHVIKQQFMGDETMIGAAVEILLQSWSVLSKKWEVQKLLPITAPHKHIVWPVTMRFCGAIQTLRWANTCVTVLSSHAYPGFHFRYTDSQPSRVWADYYDV